MKLLTFSGYKLFPFSFYPLLKVFATGTNIIDKQRVHLLSSLASSKSTVTGGAAGPNPERRMGLTVMTYLDSVKDKLDSNRARDRNNTTFN